MRACCPFLNWKSFLEGHALELSSYPQHTRTLVAKPAHLVWAEACISGGQQGDNLVSWVIQAHGKLCEPVPASDKAVGALVLLLDTLGELCWPAACVA